MLQWRVILIVFFVLFLGWGSEAQAGNSYKVDRLFATAVESYRNGDFKAAIDAGEEILREGVGSAAVYYNLGNAYSRPVPSGGLFSLICGPDDSRRGTLISMRTCLLPGTLWAWEVSRSGLLSGGGSLSSRGSPCPRSAGSCFWRSLS
ncbi:MAG: hypothetical protein GX606_02315 [Elusimicrobia bacterium]|nr:hypothetical protein [Elusimicrobiota bacterium]